MEATFYQGKRKKVKGKSEAATLDQLLPFTFFLLPSLARQTADQSCTVQPRGGVPQPEPTYSPFSTMQGTVGSPSEKASISARCLRSFCASYSVKAVPCEL